jgi:hypothetical protein
MDNTTFYNQLNQIVQQGQNNPEFLAAPREAMLRRIQQDAIKRQQAMMARPNNINISVPNGGGSFNGGGGGNQFEKFVRSIIQQESGGRYNLVEPGSRATGAYQLLPSNISEWSPSIVGRRVGYDEFLHTPKLQDQIARAQLLKYYKKYGAAGAAAAWYGGPGAVRKINSTRKQGAYPSINAYVRQVLGRAGIPF